MTGLSFIVSWLLMLTWYVRVGTTFLWLGGPSIYMTGMVIVLAVAAVSAQRHAARRDDTAPLWAVCSLAATVVCGCSIEWSFRPYGAFRMLEDTIFACLFLYFGTKRWQYILGYIFLLGSFVSSMSILGAFAPRPRVFTGFHYPDIGAYLTYAMLITVGYASGDLGPLRRILVGFRARRDPGLDYGSLSRLEKPCQTPGVVGER